MSFGCPPELEQYREVHPLAGWRGDATHGAMFVKPRGLVILWSDGQGWEHVSVSRHGRTPSWEDMCWVKEKFWGPEALVVQYHPPEADYVNYHQFCLHLWRLQGEPMPAPPGILVGLKR